MVMIDDLLSFMTPSFWAALGVALIGADLFFLGSFYVVWLGLSILIVAGIDALGAAPIFQAWSLVVVTPIVTAVGMRYLKRARKPEEMEAAKPGLVGMKCKVATINPDDPRRAIGHVSGQGEWPIYCAESELAVREIVEVVGTEGHTLLVSRGG